MSSAHVLSRVPQSYEELVAKLSTKKLVGSALQLLPFFESSIDDSLVGPLTQLATEGPRAQAVLAHHLLRAACERVAMNPAHAGNVEMLEALTQSKDLGQQLAGLWTLASFARYAAEPRRTVLCNRLASVLALLVARSPTEVTRDGPDAVQLYGAVSACASARLEGVPGAREQHREALLACVNATDSVAARHALRGLLDHKEACASAVEGLLQAGEPVNLRDPLARVYWIQLLAVELTGAKRERLEQLLDDASFRVAHEALTVLCASVPWSDLPKSRLVAPVLAALRSARPVLHFSALRATATLARAAQGGDVSALAPLEPLVAARAHHDSVFQRTRALEAAMWLAEGSPDVSALIAAEFRSGELTGALVRQLVDQLCVRCTGSEWGLLILETLNLWALHLPRALAPDSILAAWIAANKSEVSSLALATSVGMFARLRLAPELLTIAAALRRNAAFFMGQHFLRLAHNSKTRITMLAFLERLVLADNDCTAATALARIAVDNFDLRERIADFFAVFSSGLDFDASFVASLAPCHSVVQAAVENADREEMHRLFAECP